MPCQKEALKPQLGHELDAVPGFGTFRRLDVISSVFWF